MKVSHQPELPVKPHHRPHSPTPWLNSVRLPRSRGFHFKAEQYTNTESQDWGLSCLTNMNTSPITFKLDDKLSLSDFADYLESFIKAERHFVRGSQVHEMFRILGHLLATKNERKGDLFWGHSISAIFMAALAVGAPSLYHNITGGSGFVVCGSVSPVHPIRDFTPGTNSASFNARAASYEEAPVPALVRRLD